MGGKRNAYKILLQDFGAAGWMILKSILKKREGVD
jgi:hypothetical protein